MHNGMIIIDADGHVGWSSRRTMLCSRRTSRTPGSA